MLNRWAFRIAVVGFLFASVAAMPGCRSTSHGRRDHGCARCSERNDLRDAPPSEVASRNNHQHP